MTDALPYGRKCHLKIRKWTLESGKFQEFEETAKCQICFEIALSNTQLISYLLLMGNQLNEAMNLHSEVLREAFGFW